MAQSSADADRVEALLRAGAEAFAAFEAGRQATWFPFAPSDHAGAADLLQALAAEADTFVELGSGTGVATILADFCGMDSWGIECEPHLVDIAEELARRFASGARFVEGSFIPEDFRAAVEGTEEDLPTLFDGTEAWTEMGMELRDFDLIYCFPWPGHEELFQELVAAHARPDALLLSFGSTEGFRLFRGGDEVPLPA